MGDAPLPVEPERYAGRPFLRLLDSYVLWSVGELSSELDQVLVEMTPKLQEVYRSTGTWQQIVEQQMDFPEWLTASLRAMWERNLLTAEEIGDRLDAGQWARHVVDTNFI